MAAASVFRTFHTSSASSISVGPVTEPFSASSPMRTPPPPRATASSQNAPSGENLIVLIQHSDAVLETVLGLSRRSELLVVGKLDSLRSQLEQVVVALGELQGR